MDENYILPAGLLPLFAVWYFPPLVVSTVVQAFTFNRRGIWHNSKGKALGAMLVTAVLSPLLGFLALPLPMPHWLGVSENLWVLPLAWVIVFVVGFASIKLVMSHVRKSA